MDGGRSRFKNRFRFQRVGNGKEKEREEKGRRRRVELVSLGARLESRLASEKRPGTWFEQLWEVREASKEMKLGNREEGRDPDLERVKSVLILADAIRRSIPDVRYV